MRTIIQILIVALFSLSLWWGMAQETTLPQAFSDGHYPYWWDRAESGLHFTWNRLEEMGVWNEYE